MSVTGEAIAALWRTSLTQISSELEGHSLGGGMLKLEPREAEQVLLPVAAGNLDLNSLAEELDDLARNNGNAACEQHADNVFLRLGLGLSVSDVRLLKTSAAILRERRTSRN